MRNQPQYQCPCYYDNFDNRACVNYTRCDLVINKSEISFTIEFSTYSSTWVELPGENLYWPSQLKIDGKNIPIVSHNGFPSIYLNKGFYKGSGKIPLHNRPQSLRIPSSYALISLVVDGVKVERIKIDEQERVWFTNNLNLNETTSVKDDLHVRVYRKLTDNNPPELESIIKLTVSGKDREVVLGRIIPEGAMPMSFSSTLPAQLQENASVRIQLQSGEHEINIKARFLPKTFKFSVPSDTNFKVDQELWAILENPYYRNVAIKGPQAIDPMQTDIPSDWKTYPVYLMTKDIELVLDEEPIVKQSLGNKITLTRFLWLDESGKAFTVEDKIQGTINDLWRINLDSSYKLGSVKQNEELQLITLDENRKSGIEIRQGYLNVVALSRLQNYGKKILASGWDQRIESLSGQILLQPGWNLLHISGPDVVSGSWVNKWNLWNIFLILIIAVCFGKVFGLRCGIIACVMLLVTFHEPFAPKFLWLNGIASIALYKIISQSKFKKILLVYASISLVVLSIFIIRISIPQIQQGLFIQLEKSDGDFTFWNKNVISDQVMEVVEQAPPPPPPPLTYQKNSEADDIFSETSRGGASGSLTQRKMRQYISKEDRVDPSANIQTGPGKPSWFGKSISFSFSRPVNSTDTFRLYLISPFYSRILSFLRVILMIWIVYYLFMGLIYPKEKVNFYRIWKSFGTLHLLFLIALYLIFPSNLQAQFPNDTLLNNLKGFLLTPHSCFPNCANVNSGNVTIKNNHAVINLEISAVEKVIVPLPGDRSKWFPSKVLLNGTESNALNLSNGKLSIIIPQGTHTVSLQGKILESPVEIPFPMTVHNLSFESDEWETKSIINGDLPSGSLHLAKAKMNKELQQLSEQTTSNIVPFVEVERFIKLDNEWRVETTVRRKAPQTGSIELLLPLVKGELPLQTNLQDSNGFIRVMLPDNVSEFNWTSNLKKDSLIVLSATEQKYWTEIWKLSAAPKWHVKLRGIAPVPNGLEHYGTYPVWKPHPQDVCSIFVNRPNPVPGPTYTIYKVDLNSNVSQSQRVNTLNFEILSSQARQIRIEIPSVDKVEEVSVGSVAQFVSFKDDKLDISLHPGYQNIQIKWDTNEKIGFVVKTPQIKFDENPININIGANLPENRWILFTGGPTQGPAVLLWPILIAIVIFSFLLSKVSFIPVKMYQWLLLFIGLSTVETIGGLFLLPWFFLTAWRAKSDKIQTSKYFNVVQFLIVLAFFIGAAALIYAIPKSLLSNPDMVIQGVSSHGNKFSWFQDLSDKILPIAWVISLPIWVYKIVMMVWSIWVAFTIPSWVNWGWKAFTKDIVWKKSTKRNFLGFSKKKDLKDKKEN